MKRFFRLFSTMKYPVVRRDEAVSETLHGQIIQDPYRWLEDPDCAETKVGFYFYGFQEFVESQNNLFQEYIKDYPYKEKFKASLTNLFNYEK